MASNRVGPRKILSASSGSRRCNRLLSSGRDCGDTNAKNDDVYCQCAPTTMGNDRKYRSLYEASRAIILRCAGALTNPSFPSHVGALPRQIGQFVTPFGRWPTRDISRLYSFGKLETLHVLNSRNRHRLVELPCRETNIVPDQIQNCPRKPLLTT